jgi:prepilin-type N-terminal cleavage/methylation domain-containing protein
MTAEHRDPQAGFTLIELLIASVAGLILLFVVAGISMDAFRMAMLLNTRVTLNQDARVLFEILAFGGVQSGVNTTPAVQNYTFGLHGRRSSGAAGTGWAPPSDLMAKTVTATRLYRLALSPTDAVPDPAPTGSLLGPEITSFDIRCTGLNNPVVGCITSATVTMFGRLRSDTALVADGRLRELAIRLFDPYIFGNKFGSLEDSTVTFWTAFALLVDEHPT